jgi:hypothetical protein
MKTPTGTAYLQSEPGVGAPPGFTPYPVQSGPGNRGLILAIVAMIGLIVVVGVSLGAFFAIQSANRPDPVVRVDPPVVPPPAATPPPVEAPAQPTVAQEPTTAQPPAATCHVVITSDPENATILLDGMEATGMFEGDVVRGNHRVVVSAEGYQTYDQSVAFNIPGRSMRIPLVRERRTTVRQTGQAPPPSVAVPHPTHSPPPIETHPRPPPHEAETIPPNVVFQRPPPGRPGQLNNAGRVFHK